MKNVSDKVAEKIRAHIFIFDNIVSKVLQFMRWRGKVPQRRAGHGWQYNMALASCMLDNWGYKHTLRTHNTYCTYYLLHCNWWLHERFSMLRYTYIACLVVLELWLMYFMT